MIKYSEGELLNVISSPMSEDVDMISLSYALRWGVAKMIEYTIRTRLYADIDNQPESTLDYMAVELKAQYYSEDLNITKKREIIKNVMNWYIKAGTKKAVEELVNVIFESGEVVEWFDFETAGQVPGQFDINIVADITMTPELFQEFSKMIENSKSISSHLRQIAVTRPIMVDRFTGVAALHNIRDVIITRANL